ncbi:inorganic pyrophosphatase [Penicillium sp. IBT 16267x]|nr:inorganic pyrophosphatase [Penicillium sp. IBT 16267x]
MSSSYEIERLQISETGENIPPFQGYPCNYGALPQTWEDPNAIDAHTGIGGDDDPLDVCEIGSALATCGQVKRVKPLGAFALLDGGQTDWKIVAVDVGDPLANELLGIRDVERYLPGFLDSLKDWYRVYKVPEGKGENKLGMEGEVMSRQFALDLIWDFHTAWMPRNGYPDT